MKITAVGYSRRVYASHTLTDKTVSDTMFSPTEDGVEISVSRSNNLGLSGHFRLSICLSTSELQQALHCATIRRLEKRIADLEKMVASANLGPIIVTK
ncbi:hypothetical protein D3C87_1712750 [compost metagenome]